MFKIAMDKIANKVYEGSLCKDLLMHDGTIYYRTVTWTYDTETDNKTIIYDVTEVLP